MLLQSFIGKRVRLYVRCDNEGHDVTIEGLAMLGANGERSKPSVVVAKLFSDGRYITWDVPDVTDYQPLDFPPTDPRHPDYEVEPQVVTPLPLKRGLRR
jgi:hypothetical protein